VELLRWLTIGYAVVLILALAASLIAILVQLWRIGTVLGHVGASLRDVATATAPLGGYLKALHDAFVGLGGTPTRR
jgi:hypothetical protein